MDFTRISNEEYSLSGTGFSFSPYGGIALRLAGTYQPKNAATAITAIEVLREKGYNVKDEHIVNGLGGVYWPGRFEVLGRKPVFILDGSHNPQGAQATAECLRHHFGGKKIVFVIGVMADKDAGGIVKHIAGFAKLLIAVRPDNPRAMDETMLAGGLSAYDVPVIAFGSVYDGVAEAVTRAGKDGIVCALGSLFLSAEIRSAYSRLIREHLRPVEPSV